LQTNNYQCADKERFKTQLKWCLAYRFHYLLIVIVVSGVNR